MKGSEILSYGKKIKIQRVIKDLTQKELGQKVGKTQEFIYYLENDKRAPDLIEAEAIAKALETDVPTLFYSEEVST